MSAQTLTRAEFDALPALEKPAFFKAGGKITDGAGSPPAVPSANAKPMMARSTFDALPAAERAAAARSHVITDGPVTRSDDAEIMIRAPGGVGYVKTTLAELLATQGTR